jgi:hypothetical protein
MPAQQEIVNLKNSTKLNQSMKTKHHFIIAAVCLIAWLFFYLLGFSSEYFSLWTVPEQVLLSLVSCFSIAPFLIITVMVLLKQDFVKTGVWIAFYASVPFAVADYILVGIIKGEGFEMFITYWYLTLGYFYIWLIGPLIGYILKKISIRFKHRL